MELGLMLDNIELFKGIKLSSYNYCWGSSDNGIETATANELKAACFHIQGAVAANEKNFSNAIELFNKAVELAEQSHCLSDMAMYI